MKRLLFITFLVLQYTILPAQTIQKLSAEEAHAFLEKVNMDTLLIIDGRSDKMFQSGHLKNAVNIDAYKENLEEQLTTTVIPRKHLFVYCTKSTRSDSIINTLTLLGYKGDILQLSDGITGWKEHEFECIVPEVGRKRKMKKKFIGTKTK